MHDELRGGWDGIRGGRTFALDTVPARARHSCAAPYARKFAPYDALGPCFGIVGALHGLVQALLALSRARVRQCLFRPQKRIVSSAIGASELSVTVNDLPYLEQAVGGKVRGGEIDPPIGAYDGGETVRLFAEVQRVP